jgi:hypothetical protein
MNQRQFEVLKKPRCNCEGNPETTLLYEEASETEYIFYCWECHTETRRNKQELETELNKLLFG